MMVVEQRKSARALLLNDRDEVLLIRHADQLRGHFQDPGCPGFWATPGGGIEPGEQPEEALRRELLEEPGLECVQIKRQVAYREVELSLPEDGAVLSQESYFLCRVSEDPQLNQNGMSVSEKRLLKEIGWWSLEELGQMTERLRPTTIPALVENALRTDSELLILKD